MMGSLPKEKMRSKYKVRQRNRAMEKNENPYKVFLGLPSDECIDIKEGLHSGAIDKKTRIIAVEHDKTKKSIIQKNLQKLVPNKWDLHMKKLERVDLGDTKVDGMFLDLCGHISAKHSMWLHKNQKNFADGMMLAVTMNVGKRHLLSWEVVNYLGQNGSLSDTTKMILKADPSFPPNFVLKCREGEQGEQVKSLVSQINTFVIALSSKRLTMEYVSVYCRKDMSPTSDKMALVVFRVNNSRKNNFRAKQFVARLKEYNTRETAINEVYFNKEDKSKQKIKSRKPRKTRTVIVYRGKLAAYQIAKKGNLLDGRAKSYNKLKPAQRAWVTLRSKDSGLDPEVVASKIDGYLKKR